MTLSASSSCGGAWRVTVFKATSSCAGELIGKGADVRRLIERQQQRLDLLRLVARDGAGCVRPELLDDVGLAQGPFTVAAVDRFAMPKRATSAQRGDALAGRMARERRRRVALVLHTVGEE